MRSKLEIRPEQAGIPTGEFCRARRAGPRATMTAGFNRRHASDVPGIPAAKVSQMQTTHGTQRRGSCP